MMRRKSKVIQYGKTAMVAGASEGIGAAFAFALAKEGMDLILIARRQEKLSEVAEKIENQFGVKTICIQCDLADANALEIIENSITETEVDFMVYNAAVSPIGPFTNLTQENLDLTTGVNIQTPLRLIHHFGGKMLARGKGAVVVVSSLAGFQGSGFISLYGATKAFGRILAEGLWYEWRDRGVDVIACCAGATATPNYINSNPAKSSLFAPRVQSPEEVANECLRKLGKVPSFISGRGNRIASFLIHRILPRRFAVMIMGDNTRKIYQM